MATETLNLFKKDELTVEAYAKALIARVESRDEVVKAWQYFDLTHVLSKARVLDRVPHDQRGLLHEVAFGIKDVIATTGGVGPSVRCDVAH